MEIKEAQKAAANFAEERGWDINSPSQRVSHTMRELSRVAEHTLYLEGVTLKKPESDMEKQIGDVLFSLFQLANRLGIDVEEQYGRALAQDERKYPASETKERSLARLKECEPQWLAFK
jgi:NTP pyrophosphatase (non-canonical NTP hydrolase)